MKKVFNDIIPTIKPDGTPHYPGQIYRPKKHKQKLWSKSNKCGICHKSIESIELATLDHIIPRAHGGHTTKDNIQLAHKQCNYDKGHEL